jgi:hypothetical protein
MPARPGVLGHVLGGAPSERTPAHEDVLTLDLPGRSSFDVTSSEQTGAFHRARKSDSGGIR